MGLSISIPGTFLRPFVAEIGIQQIMFFFVVYNVVAFAARVGFRRAPQVIGIRNAILMGLGFMTLSMASYVFVDSKIALVIPAVLGGIAHSFLFPSVVAGGTAFFPKENRGLATSLVLAMYDVGVLVGSPLVGISVTVARSMDLPAYPITFLFVSGTLLVAALLLFFNYERGDGRGVVRRK